MVARPQEYLDKQGGGKEEQDEVEEAAGSSSGGSETERLEPVCCGTVGSEQINEAAHPPSAADDAK